jgi:hypothetical protein
LYELTDYSPGGVYQLDPGDGGARQSFSNGKLYYTYQKAGKYVIGIYAVDGNKEYKILSVNKQVADVTKPKGTSEKTGKPLVDD